MMFCLDINEREETQADYSAEVRSKLQSAFVQAKHLEDATLQSIADKLGVNKSVVYRQLNGQTNLTVKTISDLAWALGKVPHLQLRDKHAEIRRTFSTSNARLEMFRKSPSGTKNYFSLAAAEEKSFDINPFQDVAA